MSKIIASIADAERLADLCELNRRMEDAAAFRSRATAARAEHAEIVEAMRVIRSPHVFHGVVIGTKVTLEFCTPSGAQEFMRAYNSLDSLLSRVGGGA